MSWDYADEDDLRELYFERGLNVYEVAEKCDCAASTVPYWMDKFGMERRGESPEKIPRDDLIDAMECLAEELGSTPTAAENREHGEYDSAVYQRRFESWNDAVEAAGLEPNTHDLVQYECEHCGDDFEVSIYYEENDRTPNFCSRECRTADRRSIEMCDYCGKEFECRNFYKENGWNSFCSDECYRQHRSESYSDSGHPKWVERTTVECLNCGDEIERLPSMVRERNFCDYDCLGEWNAEQYSGEGSPVWNGGKQYYYGPNWRKQRRKAMERDGHECKVCGISREQHREECGEDLHCHHRRKILEFKSDGEVDFEAANELSNLVILCQEHHKLWERQPVQIQV